MAETDTKSGEEQGALDALHEAVANTAYFLWEQDGRPEGDAEKYWQRAEVQHLRQRAYDIWLREGAPKGTADDFWNRARGEAGE